MSIFSQQTSVNCRGRLLDLSRPKVMGILNLTPDSFYDGNHHSSLDKALFQTERMLKEGAEIIDLGGMSSRPGAEIISVEEEIKRVLPVLKSVLEKFPNTIISIDTVRSEVAREALLAGAHIINDISAGKFDYHLHDVVAQFGAPYILMHMQGSPGNMQDHPRYESIITEITDFFIKKIENLRSKGIIDIIIDPGFGFGKTISNNYSILKNLSAFKMLNLPVLAGISRKSMIYKSLDIKPEEALNGTTALNMVALQQGARILRVHDVKEAVETIRLWEQIESAPNT